MRAKRREGTTLCRHRVFSASCPSDIFAHSFEHVPGINISPYRQRNDP